MRLAERAHVPEQGRRATHSQPSPPANTKEHFISNGIQKTNISSEKSCNIWAILY
jgi:hypothetical protein